MKILFCFLFMLSFIISVDCSSYAQSSLNLNLDSSSKNCVAVIRKNGKLGIVNALGEWIAQPVYSQLGNISTQEQYMNLEWKSGMEIWNGGC